MEALQITTSEKRIPIIRDGQEAGVLVFNPNDVTFAEKFYRLIGEFQQKLTEYRLRADVIEKIQAIDENNLPVNVGDRLTLQHEACVYIREQIDALFGVDTSQKVFGSTLDLDLFPQFFNGITPYIQAARNSRVERYSNKPIKRVKK